MKKILFVAMMAVCALTANAQTSEVGKITLTPQVGYVFSGGYAASIFTVGDESNKLETTSNAGYRFGAELGIQAAKWFKPTVGVFYYHGGLDAKFAGSKIGEATMNYINVPIMANFYVFNGFALKVGIQPSFLASAKESNYDNSASVNAEDDVKSFDFQIPVGLSYEFHNFVIDARANIATGTFLKKDKGISKGSFKIDDLRNDYLTISLGYKFELN